MDQILDRNDGNRSTLGCIRRLGAGDKEKQVTGPCMCGDPYCWSCGNPGLLDYELLADDVAELLDEHTGTWDDELIDKLIELISNSVLAHHECSSCMKNQQDATEWAARYYNLKQQLRRHALTCHTVNKQVE